MPRSAPWMKDRSGSGAAVPLEARASRSRYCFARAAASCGQTRSASWPGLSPRATGAPARRLIEANLRLVVVMARRYQGLGLRVPGSRAGGDGRSHPGGRPLRLAPRAAVLDLRGLVDPPVDPARADERLAHDPAAEPARHETAGDAARLRCAGGGARPRADRWQEIAAATGFDAGRDRDRGACAAGGRLAQRARRQRRGQRAAARPRPRRGGAGPGRRGRGGGAAPPRCAPRSRELRAREREIVISHFGLDCDPQTLEQIACSTAPRAGARPPDRAARVRDARAELDE